MPRRRRRSGSATMRTLGEHAWIARPLGRLGSGRPALARPRAAAAAPPARPPAPLRPRAGRGGGVPSRLGGGPPAALGRRILRVNLSDVAAMGGDALAALVSIEAPRRLPVRVLDGVMRGLAADARRHGVDVVGGNLAAAPRLAITVTLLGQSGRRLATRAGARPGDDVWLTGTIGGAGCAVRALLAGRPGRRPGVPVRLGAGRVLAPLVHAMIDVSDGLVQDLGHVCRASGVAAEVGAATLPVAAACRRALGAA